jgi:hypothetical protein
MKFLRKQSIDGMDTFTRVEMDYLDDVRKFMDYLFRTDPRYISIEEVEYKNGGWSMSLKDGKGKILLEFKLENPLENPCILTTDKYSQQESCGVD